LQWLGLSCTMVAGFEQCISRMQSSPFFSAESWAQSNAFPQFLWSCVLIHAGFSSAVLRFSSAKRAWLLDYNKPEVLFHDMQHLTQEKAPDPKRIVLKLCSWLLSGCCVKTLVGSDYFRQGHCHYGHSEGYDVHLWIFLSVCFGLELQPLQI
jgi:hypothetical protein